MKDLLLAVLLIILFGEVFYLYKANTYRSKPKVLAIRVESSSTLPPTETPTPVPTSTPTPAPTARPTAKPTQKPTPTPVPQPKFSSQEINSFIERFSGQYSVDPNVIRHIALCESGFNPGAVKLSYYGLFQFGPVTWKNIRIKMGEDSDINLRLNAEEAVQTAAFAVSQHKGGIWPNCMP